MRKKQIKQLSGNQVLMDSLSTINKTMKAEYDKMKTDHGGLQTIVSGSIMKAMFKKLLFFNLLFWAIFFNAQSKPTDSTEFVPFDCSITQTKQRLDKRFFCKHQTHRVESEQRGIGVCYFAVR